MQHDPKSGPLSTRGTLRVQQCPSASYYSTTASAVAKPSVARSPTWILTSTERMGPGPGLWNGTSEVLKSVSHETYLDLGEATLRIHEALSLQPGRWLYGIGHTLNKL